MDQAQQAYLLDIVEVDKTKRVRCQADGCGHSVYARIHVVLVDGEFRVLGGDCFQRLYGHSLAGVTSFYGGSVGAPTQLDDDMRALLESNTAEFIERLEARRLELEALAKAIPRGVSSAASSGDAAVATRGPATNPRRPLEIGSSAAEYEGAAMLRWKWIEDRGLVKVRMDEYALHPKPVMTYVDSVLAHYRSFDLNKTPYQFALSVELRTCLPKPAIFQALHRIGLIEHQ